MLRKISFTIFAALFGFALTVQGQSRDLPDFTELVDQDGGLVDVGMLKQIVEQGRLAAAQEAGNHRNGDSMA